MEDIQETDKVNGVEHWHIRITGFGEKATSHSHKGGHKRHDHQGMLEYGRTYKNLLANKWRDFR